MSGKRVIDGMSGKIKKVSHSPVFCRTITLLSGVFLCLSVGDFNVFSNRFYYMCRIV